MKRVRVIAIVATFVVVCTTFAVRPLQAQTPTAAPPVAAPAAQPDHEIEVAADAFVKDARIPTWVEPRALVDSLTEGPAVLRLLDHQIMVGAQNTIYVRIAVKINDAGALTPLGRVPVAFIPAYQKVVLHALQVLRDGAVLDRLPAAQIRFLQRETGLEQNLYNGVVTASILIDDLRVGDTLEAAYSIIGTNPVFGPMYGSVENWDQQLPVDDRRIVFNAPAARSIRWQFHGDLVKDFPRPSEHLHDGIRSLTFEARDLPRVTAEQLTPPGFSTFRWIQFSEYDDWQGVATWAASLFAASSSAASSSAASSSSIDEPPDATRAAIVASLMKKPTTQERVVGALEFVQSQVRYFSVSLGTSSHRPTAPNTVLARRYGDCKDKSLLLVTLLKDMGIASTPVLARLGNRRGFDDWLPTPLAFDHVIVAVDLDGRRYWLDSTRQGQHGDLATMGQAHDGAEVLPASTSDGRLQRIDEPNREALELNEVVETLTVPALDGDATLKVVQTLHGVAAETVRSELGMTTKERVTETLTNDMQTRYPEAVMTGARAIDDDRDTNRLTLTAAFALKKPLEHADGQYRVHFRPPNFVRLFVLPREAVRRTPISLRYPVHAVYRFDVQFADDVAVVESHATKRVDGRYFRAIESRAIVANHADVTLTMETLGNEIAAADVAVMRDDIRNLDRTFATFVAIRESDVKQPAFLGLGAKDFATTLKEQQQGIVTRVTAAIASGRLTGVDLARAYCTRANAYASLGERDLASHDADHVVEADPNTPPALICRAQIALLGGRFDAAVDDASQAIVLSAEHGRPWQLRGEARFFLGQYAAAADDFAKASTLDSDEHVNVNHDIWLAMASRRMDKPLPDDLARRAAESRDAPWPRPALALLADRIGPDELAAIAASRHGDEATMAGTEADFYIGEFLLARGDVAKARDAFESARARGVIVYAEYGAARLELGRLAAPGR